MPKHVLILVSTITVAGIAGLILNDCLTFS